MSNNSKILYISQEITPYLKETALGKMCQTIPHKVHEKGHEVRTFMPKYGTINERRNQLHEVIRLSGMNLVVDDTDHPLIIKVATLQQSRMQVYFIDNDDFFHHAAPELEIYSHPEDNDERIIFFVRGVMETVKKLRWTPSVIHCSGWLTALAPMYIKKLYAEDPTIGKAKVVTSVFSSSFPGILDSRFIEKLKMEGLSDSDLLPLKEGEPVDYQSLVKLAIRYSDGLIQASDDVDSTLLEYAASEGIPLIKATEEEPDADNVVAFYEQISARQ